MNTQVIRGGDIQSLSINGVEIPIPEETEAKIVFTVKNRDARSNDITQCTANTIISYGKREKAGIYGTVGRLHCLFFLILSFIMRVPLMSDSEKGSCHS